MHAIGILRDGPQYRISIAQGNARYSKAKLEFSFLALFPISVLSTLYSYMFSILLFIYVYVYVYVYV